MSDCEKLARMVYTAGQLASTSYARGMAPEAQATVAAEALRNTLTDLGGFLGSEQDHNNPECRVGVMGHDANYNGGFKDSGFDSKFQDRSNQVRHFIGWFWAGFVGGNHDIVRNRLYQQEGTSDPNDPDVGLGLKAIELGDIYGGIGNYKDVANAIWHQVCNQQSDLY